MLSGEMTGDFSDSIGRFPASSLGERLRGDPRRPFALSGLGAVFDERYAASVRFSWLETTEPLR